MKRTLLVIGIPSFLIFLAATAVTQAGIYVGVGFGSGHCYHGGYYGHYYNHGPYCYGPTVIYSEPTVVYAAPAPVTVVESAPATQVVTPASVPYGFIQSGGLLKSPYSSFTMSLGGRSSGDIVYDANNGKPFKVP